jgi:hypothetical protein
MGIFAPVYTHAASWVAMLVGIWRPVLNFFCEQARHVRHVVLHFPFRVPELLLTTFEVVSKFSFEILSGRICVIRAVSGVMAWPYVLGLVRLFAYVAVGAWCRWSILLRFRNWSVFGGIGTIFCILVCIILAILNRRLRLRLISRHRRYELLISTCAQVGFDEKLTELFIPVV